MVFPWLAAATLGGGLLAYHGARRANKANAASARDVMEFQQYNSDTSVRRAMKDMEAAGINPLLAGKYGASTPSGSMFTSENEFEAAPTAVGSAIQLKRMKAELENLHEQNLNLRAQNLQIGSQTELNAASAAKLRAETDMLKYQRLQEKALLPVYDAAGRIVDWGVSSAKQSYNELTGAVSSAFKSAKRGVSYGVSRVKHHLGEINIPVRPWRGS